MVDEGDTTCCYARSEKHWVTDPQGIAWEQFHTLDNIPVFSQSQPVATTASACCAPGGTGATAASAQAGAGAEAVGCCTPAGAPTSTATPAVVRGKPIGIAVKSSSGACC
jgi:hypothetical protein